MILHRYTTDITRTPIVIERLDFTARETPRQFITEPMTTRDHQFLTKHINKDGVNKLNPDSFTGEFFSMWRTDTDEKAFVKAVIERVSAQLTKAEMQMKLLQSDYDRLLAYQKSDNS